MTDRQWTMPDIAAHLGVARSTVRWWLHMHQMPEPTGRTVRSPWWQGEQIETWLRERAAGTEE